MSILWQCSEEQKYGTSEKSTNKKFDNEQTREGERERESQLTVKANGDVVLAEMRREVWKREWFE